MGESDTEHHETRRRPTVDVCLCLDASAAAMSRQPGDKCAAIAVVDRHSSDRPGQAGSLAGPCLELAALDISRGRRCLGKAQSVCTSEP